MSELRKCWLVTNDKLTGFWVWGQVLFNPVQLLRSISTVSIIPVLVGNNKMTISPIKWKDSPFRGCVRTICRIIWCNVKLKIDITRWRGIMIAENKINLLSVWLMFLPYCVAVIKVIAYIVFICLIKIACNYKNNPCISTKGFAANIYQWTPEYSMNSVELGYPF